VRDADRDVDVLVSADLLQVRTDGAIAPGFSAVLDADPDLPELVDGWTVHPYPSPRDRSPVDDSGDQRFAFDRVELIHALAVERDVDRPIWITEVGWSTAPAAEGAVDEAAQARYVRQALDRALDTWGGWVERIFLYSFDRSSGPPGDLEAHFGLRREDGSPTPAWDEVMRRADG
jgi:exo-beta-1,3-glucanase (GH17 family)